MNQSAEDSLREEVGQLRRKVEELVDKKSELLKDKATFLEEKMTIRRILIDKENQLQNLQTDMSVQLDSYKTDIQKLQEANQSLKNSSDEYKQKCEMLENTIVIKSDDVARLEQLNASMRELSQHQANEIDALKAKEKQLLELRTELVAYNTCKSDLQKAMAENANMANQLQASQKRLHELVDREDHLVKANQKLTVDIRHQSEAYDQLQQVSRV